VAYHRTAALVRAPPGRSALIAFGLSIAEPEPYDRYSAPGLRRAVEPDSEVFAFASVGTFARTYNLILDAAARRDDLEALVLLHPHVEIADLEFCRQVREALSDPEVAVAGSVGATGVRSLAWWRGSMRSAEVVHEYHDHGGGRLSAYAWAQPERGGGEVDTVDGFLMVLSPWAVRNLRFDETLIQGYGLDLDLCLQARAAGRTVAVADLRVVFHRRLPVVDDSDLWVEAHKQFAVKWEGRWPGAEPEARDWKERARRAEAEREAARAMAMSRELAADARVVGLEQEMEDATSSLGWRLTEPLRQLNKWRGERRRPG
jgi:hypothetical protein